MTIMAESASLITASVEIKALMIGKKQMTLAVFRQLPKQFPFELESGEWRGTPWGHVNYCPNDCAAKSPHMHIVWQEDKALFRSSFATGDPTIMATHKNGLLESMLVSGDITLKQIRDLASGSPVTLWARDRTDSVRFECVLNEALLQAALSYTDRDWRDSHCGRKVKDLADFFLRKDGRNARDVLYDECMGIVWRHRRMRAKANLLDQLFIAV